MAKDQPSVVSPVQQEIKNVSVKPAPALILASLTPAAEQVELPLPLNSDIFVVSNNATTPGLTSVNTGTQISPVEVVVEISSAAILVNSQVAAATLENTNAPIAGAVAISNDINSSLGLYTSTTKHDQYINRY